MGIEEFKQKYEELKDNPMYKNFCSILDTKNQVLERTAKKNQELKKQLEKKYEKVGTLTGELLYEENTKLINQQKEFVKWLEEKIKNYELPLNDENKKALGYTLPMKGIYKEILSKYKEIVGGNNDQ